MMTSKLNTNSFDNQKSFTEKKSDKPKTAKERNENNRG